jgi:MoaA/NifB/PqqE/SkfB family radical SAM enzyme
MSVLNYAIPPILQLEPTTACNLDCPFCLRSSLNRSGGDLSFDNFRQIVDKSRSRYLTLHGWGEPLLHPKLPAMIRYAAGKKLSVNFTTNATLLPERTEELLNSGLDAIAFSFPESQKFTPIITQNAARFVQERSARKQKLPKTYINIALIEGNFNCIDEGLGLAAAAGVDQVNFERSFPWTEKEAKTEKGLFTTIRNAARKSGCKVTLPLPHTHPCPLCRLTLFVRWNGDVAPCCYRADLPLGNLLEDNLSTILQNRVTFLKKMKSDPVCRECRV